MRKEASIIFLAVAGMGAMCMADAPATTQAADHATIAALIAKLGDDSFQVREQANAQLRRLGDAALEDLEAARATENPEVRTRLDELVADILRDDETRGNNSSGGPLKDRRIVEKDTFGHLVKIYESAAGIDMSFTNAAGIEQHVTAKDPDDLAAKNPEAAAVFKKYAGDGFRSHIRVLKRVPAPVPVTQPIP